MNYISNRKITVVSTSGRSVEFEKGVETFAPPIMHAELISAGIIPADAVDEPEGDQGPADPVVPQEREDAMFKVFEQMALANRREDFSGTGQPHVGALQKALGWKNKISNKERDAAWAKFQQGTSPV